MVKIKLLSFLMCSFTLCIPTSFLVACSNKNNDLKYDYIADVVDVKVLSNYSKLVDNQINPTTAKINFDSQQIISKNTSSNYYEFNTLSENDYPISMYDLLQDDKDIQIGYPHKVVSPDYHIPGEFEELLFFVVVEMNDEKWIKSDINFNVHSVLGDLSLFWSSKYNAISKETHNYINPTVGPTGEIDESGKLFYNPDSDINLNAEKLRNNIIFVDNFEDNGKQYNDCFILAFPLNLSSLVFESNFFLQQGGINNYFRLQIVTDSIKMNFFDLDQKKYKINFNNENIKDKIITLKQPDIKENTP